MIQVWLFPKPPQEGKIMLTLRHPHLVPIYGCGDFTKGGCSGFFRFECAYYYCHCSVDVYFSFWCMLFFGTYVLHCQ